MRRPTIVRIAEPRLDARKRSTCLNALFAMVLASVTYVTVQESATCVTARVSVVSATDRESVRVAEKGRVISVRVQASATCVRVRVNATYVKVRGSVHIAAEKARTRTIPSESCFQLLPDELLNSCIIRLSLGLLTDFQDVRCCLESAAHGVTQCRSAHR